MCGCDKHLKRRAKCTCICPEHANFQAAYDLAMSRMDVIRDLEGRLDRALTAQPSLSAEQVEAIARALVRHDNPGMGDDLVVKYVDDSAEFLAVQGRYEAWKSEVDGTHDALIWALAEAGLTVAGETQ